MTDIGRPLRRIEFEPLPADVPPAETPQPAPEPAPEEQPA